MHGRTPYAILKSMTKKTFNLISIFIIAIFVLALSYFVTGIVLEKTKGEERADAVFQNLARTTQLASSSYSVNSYSFSNAFINAAGDLANYESLTLKINESILFSYPKKIESSKTAKTKKYTTRIRVQENSFLEIEASIYKVNPNFIFNYAKTSFFIVLGGTLVALAFLIFAKAEDSKDDEVFYEEEYTARKKVEAQAEKEDAEPFLTEEEKKLLFDDDESKKEISVDENTKIQDEILSEESIKEEKIIGSEENLLAGIEESLIDSVSKEEDLSVLIVRSEFLKRDENYLEEENKEVLECFSEVLGQNYSVYGYGPFGYAILIKNTNLDEAVSLSEKLLEKINSCIKNTNKTFPVTMGISSRTGRTLSGERLLREASEAERHAQNEPTSPIIAFRINPEKYKNFILNN